MLRVQVVDGVLSIAGICGSPDAEDFSQEVTPEKCRDCLRAPHLLIELVRGDPPAIRLAGANVGSAGTNTGNPQNIYIGLHSGISCAAGLRPACRRWLHWG